MNPYLSTPTDGEEHSTDLQESALKMRGTPCHQGLYFITEEKYQK